MYNPSSLKGCLPAACFHEYLPFFYDKVGFRICVMFSESCSTSFPNLFFPSSYPLPGTCWHSQAVKYGIQLMHKHLISIAIHSFFIFIFSPIKMTSESNHNSWFSGQHLISNSYCTELLLLVRLSAIIQVGILQASTIHLWNSSHLEVLNLHVPSAVICL